MDIFTATRKTAEAGCWIKDKHRNDRSVGYVKDISENTNMMKVYYPKIHKSCWVQWKNHGHYTVI